MEYMVKFQMDEWWNCLDNNSSRLSFNDGDSVFSVIDGDLIRLDVANKDRFIS